VSIIASPTLGDFGAWLELLLAESLSKNGKGLIPIDGEPPGRPEVYGNDRLFVYLREADAPGTEQDALADALEKSGQPVVRVAQTGHLQLGQQFFLWEFATAVAGNLLGVNPFDQPDIEASKNQARSLSDTYNKDGGLSHDAAFFTADGISLFADAANAAAVKADSLDGVLKAHLARVEPGNYVGILAFIARDPQNRAALQTVRTLIRDAMHVATCAEFGPRFLHSTGQAYKGGPNSGVFMQITADDSVDLPVPGERYSFGVVKAAQARGDFEVLSEFGRRALRIHVGGDVQEGLAKLTEHVKRALK
jgi:transaldolase / glucose-6-phosphate isomerase